MSQMSVATTVARRAPKGASRTALHVVRSSDRAGSAWFPVLCVTLLLAGLAVVLTLNTIMAHDSFEVGKLEDRSAALSDSQAALTEKVNARSSPQKLAESAADLGMVPSASAAFIDVDEGKVLGVAEVAEAGDRINVGAGSTTTTEETATGPNGEQDQSKKDEANKDATSDKTKSDKAKSDEAGSDKANGSKADGKDARAEGSTKPESTN